MVGTLYESHVESAALDWLADLGYTVLYGPDIAPGEPSAERAEYGQLVLEGRLRDALDRLNPALPPETLGDAFRKLTRLDAPALAQRNRAFHRLLVEGVTVEYCRPDGSIAGAQACMLDFDDPANNNWLAVNQFTVVENRVNRRPDIVLFVNGLPLGVLELKHLRHLLRVAAGGVVFTTIQKFLPEPRDRYPLLSDRLNIIFITDEAHRSQYGFRAHIARPEGEDPYLAYGFAAHLRGALPNASYIGFTGTPIEQADHNTPAVFGDYIDVYDIQRAVEDKATVPIYYEVRLVQLDLDPRERPTIDPEFEEVTEGEELEQKEGLKSKWPDALAISDDLAFFQAIRASLVKFTPAEGKTPAQLDSAIRQILSRAVVP